MPLPVPECPRFPNKKQYATESEAAEVAAKRTKAEGFTIRYFHCKDCDFFHLSKRQA